MLRDFLLASLHHLLFFGLIAMLAAESAVLKRGVDRASIVRLSRLDAAYGMTAGLLLVVGGLRIAYGIKGWDVYAHNPWFHAKLGAFVLAAALSIIPSIRFARWRRLLRDDPAYLPTAEDVGRLRPLLAMQGALIAVILVCAAGMARHGGL